MIHGSPGRYALTALYLAWLATGAAFAQDPRATAAQAAARDWLVLTDRGDAKASWNAASKRFRTALPLSAWVAALKRERTPLGAMQSRTAIKSGFRKTFPGIPDGDYAQVAYATSFAHRTFGHESLTLQRDGDGKWRVVGYSVR